MKKEKAFRMVNVLFEKTGDIIEQEQDLFHLFVEILLELTNKRKQKQKLAKETSYIFLGLFFWIKWTKWMNKWEYGKSKSWKKSGKQIKYMN